MPALRVPREAGQDGHQRHARQLRHVPRLLLQNVPGLLLGDPAPLQLPLDVLHAHVQLPQPRRLLPGALQLPVDLLSKLRKQITEVREALKGTDQKVIDEKYQELKTLSLDMYSSINQNAQDADKKAEAKK